MNTKTIQNLTIAAIIFSIGAIDSIATSLYWQHVAITHHAAHFEVNSWGITSYHWNDEYAQTPLQPVADPVKDSLIPPPIKDEHHK
jgi:hypothetical protein